jgi:hypothetical protein
MLLPGIAVSIRTVKSAQQVTTLVVEGGQLPGRCCYDQSTTIQMHLFVCHLPLMVAPS